MSSNEYFNHNYLSKIDSEKKAYILGWFMTGSFNDSTKTIYIKTNKYNFECLNMIKNTISNKFNIKINSSNITLFIKSKRLYTCVNREHDIPDELILFYYRGLVEGAGSFNVTNLESPQYEIKINKNVSKINELNIFGKKIDTKIVYIGTNCIDLLGKIYENKDNKSLLLSDTYSKFITFTDWRHSYLKDCKCYKTEMNAIIPTKSSYSDVGYDVSIIKKYKDLKENTTLYDTGLKFNVPFGYYYLLYPRSSLSKSGYILTNSVGVIEKNYSGNLLISLTKVSSNAIDIEFPFKCCQIVFYPQVFINIIPVIESSDNKLEDTKRGDGGFGSTDIN